MAVTLGGFVTIHKVEQRVRAVTRDEATGAARTELTLRGKTLFSGTAAATWAQAKEIERLLGELADNPAYGPIHVADDQVPRDSGWYDLREASATVGETTALDGLIDVSVTLSRLGGAGAGGNVARWLYLSPALTANSWSITSTPWAALPIGASSLTTVDTVARSGQNGSQVLKQAAERFVHDAADCDAGEVRLYDTGGSAVVADWARVFSPDHRFASPAHMALDNGLIRLTPIAASPGRHAINVWDGSSMLAVSPSATNGDSCIWGAATPTAWRHAVVNVLTPWCIEVTWWMTSTTSPYIITKTYRLERGKNVAKLTLTSNVAASLDAGFIGSSTTMGRLVMGRNSGAGAADNLGDGYDSVYDTALATVPNADDNWVVSTAPGQTALLIVAAEATTGTTFYKSASHGILFEKTGATSFSLHLGAVAYPTTRLFAEAESSTLLGTATTTAAVAAQASPGSGSSAVQLDALNEGVSFTGLGPPIAAGKVRAYCRIRNEGVNAGDSVTFDLFDGTTSYAAVTKTHAELGSATTFKVISTEYDWSAGTPATLYPRIRRTVAGTTNVMYVDSCWWVVYSNGLLGYAKDIANAALTQVTAWPATIRAVR